MVSVSKMSKSNLSQAMTFLYGFFIATFFACGMSFTHALTNVSKKWIFTFGLGGALGECIMPLDLGFIEIWPSVRIFAEFRS